MVKVKDDFINLQTFLINNKMTINDSKTQLMTIKSKMTTNEASFQINDVTINTQPSMKILGVTLTPDLAFNEHLWEGKSSMTTSLNSKLAMLRKIKPYIPKKILGQVGANLINSTISYAAPLWGTTGTTNQARIQKLQTKGARIITSKGWKKEKITTHRQDLLDQLNWPNVGQLIHTSTLNTTKRALDKTSSSQLNNMFTLRKPKHPRDTTAPRISHKGNLNRKEDPFSARAVEFYNELPPNLRDPNSTRVQFKSQIKKYSRTLNLLNKH